MSRYTIFAANLDTGLLSGVTDQGININENDIVIGGDGTVDATYAARMSEDPRISFTTTSIADALTDIALSGYSYSSAQEFHFQKLTNTGTRAGTLSHLSISTDSGLIVPGSIKASSNGLAEMDVECHCLSSDGSTHPWTIALSQTLPAVPSVSEAFTIGKVMINGTELEEVQSITFDFGISVTGDGHSGGLPYPTFVAIETRRPTIRITTNHLDALDTYKPQTAVDASDVIVYFRKLSEGGTRVADGTAEHVKLTVDDGIISVGSASGSGSSQATGELTIIPTYDGTNDVVAINNASAIA